MCTRAAAGSRNAEKVTASNQSRPPYLILHSPTPRASLPCSAANKGQSAWRHRTLTGCWWSEDASTAIDVRIDSYELMGYCYARDHNV